MSTKFGFIRRPGNTGCEITDTLIAYCHRFKQVSLTHVIPLTDVKYMYMYSSYVQMCYTQTLHIHVYTCTCSICQNAKIPTAKPQKLISLTQVHVMLPIFHNKQWITMYIYNHVLMQQGRTNLSPSLSPPSPLLSPSLLPSFLPSLPPFLSPSLPPSLPPSWKERPVHVLYMYIHVGLRRRGQLQQPTAQANSYHTTNKSVYY